MIKFLKEYFGDMMKMCEKYKLNPSIVLGDYLDLLRH